MKKNIDIKDLALFFYYLPDKSKLWSKIDINFDHWVCFKNYRYEEISKDKNIAEKWINENNWLLLKKISIIEKEMEIEKTLKQIRDVISEIKDKEIADKSDIYFNEGFYYINIARRFKDKSVWVLSDKNWTRWKNKKKIDLFIITKDENVLF